ncbi:MAG: excinuclease ABC subunit UvrA [Planctomycetes bacterium]|nr:excinuclease ABC subunit UvrA [Planctomycetota bacterium]
MAEEKFIRIKGAREHNLKNVDIDIPRDKFVVITGISGSGKSSLAFDTIYAEGQRRYVESLSAYARQFLEQMQKPDVEYIEGLPPTISIEQRAGNPTPRSTVATSTEIYDYLRLLFARIGDPYCCKCKKPISQQTSQQIIDAIMAYPAGTCIVLMAPLARGEKGRHRELFQMVRREGFLKVRVDGEIKDVHEVLALLEDNEGKQTPAKRRKKSFSKKAFLDKNTRHNIEVIVDRITIQPGIKNRIADSVETTLRTGEGMMIASVQKNEHKSEEKLFSQHYACPYCNISIEDLSPRMFSFNSPAGACPVCAGLGTKLELDVDLIIPDPMLSLSAGAVEAWRKVSRRLSMHYYRVLWDFVSAFNVNPDTPFVNLSDNIKEIFLYGADDAAAKKYGAPFEGVMPELQKRFFDTSSDYVKNRILEYMSELPCPKCKGARLKNESLSVLIAGKNIFQVTQMTIEKSLEFLSSLSLAGEQEIIARQILKEITARLEFLRNVGLEYLTLDRKTSTLAGGEAQRIRLASQIGSGLVGVCYVLDEPTIGLHQRDNAKLIGTIRRLKDIGNSVIVVEHDEETINCADYVIDVGPGAGEHGGTIVAQGTPEQLSTLDGSLTVKYLKGELKIEVPKNRRPYDLSNAIEIRGARENNLKNVNVKFPLGVFCCVTGVSGSGKSTLVNDILYKGLMKKFYHSKEKPGEHDKIINTNMVDKVIVIDQSPIGRTPRSNPATYTGVFSEVRNVFAMTKEARMRGYQIGRFSFNIKGGRCEACEGQGTKLIEMHFLPDVYVACEECKGKRYNRETLEIKFKGKNIAEVLDMRADEALDFFQNFPKIVKILSTLTDVGLGYVALGQSSTTLSGGEAQRVKLAAELGKSDTGKTLYILDEPTTGLHFADISKLLKVLNRLVDLGNTVLVIEHNMHMIKCADYIIDLGPEGGERGGEIVAKGSPDEIIRNGKSYTGEFLRQYLT